MAPDADSSRMMENTARFIIGFDPSYQEWLLRQTLSALRPTRQGYWRPQNGSNRFCNNVIMCFVWDRSGCVTRLPDLYLDSLNSVSPVREPSMSEVKSEVQSILNSRAFRQSRG